MVSLMLSARRTGVTTTVVTDSESVIRALKRLCPRRVIFVDGGKRASG